ncbi:MAG: VWA domain-containing protein, partial [Bacteroidota bacterium]
ISDLYEGGNENELFRRIHQVHQSGVQLITLLALNDQGAPMYDKSNAAKLAQLGLPAFSCTPGLFPDLMAAAIQKESIHNWMARNGVVAR